MHSVIHHSVSGIFGISKVIGSEFAAYRSSRRVEETVVSI